MNCPSGTGIRILIFAIPGKQPSQIRNAMGNILNLNLDPEAGKYARACR